MRRDMQKYFASLNPSPKRKSKYNNVKTVVDGKTFDSMREAKRYSELMVLLRAKKIRDLKLQVEYPLIPPLVRSGRKTRGRKYIADFTYWEGNQFVVEDVKGKRTDEYLIKRDLMLWIHNIEIRET